MQENNSPVQETPTEAPKIENPSKIKAACGIPGAKPQITEQMIQNLKLIEGKPTVYVNPRTDGQQYKGEISYVDNTLIKKTTIASS